MCCCERKDCSKQRPAGPGTLHSMKEKAQTDVQTGALQTNQSVAAHYWIFSSVMLLQSANQNSGNTHFRVGKSSLHVTRKNCWLCWLLKYTMSKLYNSEDSRSLIKLLNLWNKLHELLNVRPCGSFSNHAENHGFWLKNCIQHKMQNKKINCISALWLHNNYSAIMLGYVYFFIFQVFTIRTSNDTFVNENPCVFIFLLGNPTFQYT